MILLKSFYFSIGLLALILGVIGVMTPLLPTTPFLILAAACFAKSSPRFHNWLTQHKTFGPAIKDWQSHGVIKKPAKRLATVMIFISALLPGFIVPSLHPMIRLVTFVVFAAVLAFIWTRPSEARIRKIL